MKLCLPQSNFVIIEQIHINKSGMPGIGNTIGPSLNQVYRRIMQVCDSQDYLFDGKKIETAPTTWQYIQDFVSNGKRISTRSTGQKQFFLAYAGFRNMLTPLPKYSESMPEAITKEYDWGSSGSPLIYGEDPIPNINLYANKKAEFVAVGGQGAPTAVGIYNGRSGELILPPANRRNQLIQSLIAAQPL